MFGTICDEIEVNAPASAAWEVYGTLKLAELVEKGLPAVIDKIEVVEGDGSAGTILKLVFAPGALGFSYYTEKFTKVDDETRVKVTEVVEGGYLDAGFNLYRVRFEIIEKDEKSCITKATIEYDIKEDYAANASLVSIEPLKVTETKQQIVILESYLEQRGVALPEGYFSCRVVCPNPKFSTIQSNFPSEVITYEQWIQMKKEAKSTFTGWIKGAFSGGKKEMEESMQQKLSFILSTAPMWDRLELKGKFLLGEFLEFKGKQDHTQALRNIKRSKVNRVIIQKTSMLGLAHSKLQVLYSPRDYRSEGASGSEWKEVTVRSSTEALFQPQNSTKVRKYKLSSIISMPLSA